MKVYISPIAQKQLGVKPESSSIPFESLTKKWEAEKRWDKKHPVQARFKHAWWCIRYAIARHIDDAMYEVKWGFQRMFRGYDDPHVWNYCYYTADLNIKILKRLKKNKLGYPIIFLNKKEEKKWELTWNKNSKTLDKMYEKRWDDALTAIIKGWEAIIKEDDVHIKTKGKYDHEKSEIKRKELGKVFDEGMKLYTKHYRGLWD